MIVNRHFKLAFVAGGMELSITGTATPEDIEDCENILELAIRQLRRIREENISDAREAVRM